MDQRSVVLVEDNEGNRIVYATVLEHRGQRVYEATTGQEATRLARGARTPPST